MGISSYVKGAKRIAPNLSLQQIIGIAKLVCAGAEAICPVVDGMFARSYRNFSPRTLQGLLPHQVARAYNLPVVAPDKMKRRKVAIIELGGLFSIADVYSYCDKHGYVKPQITTMFVDGATQASDDADGEVCLDIDVVAGVAPGIHIVVVFAPNTDQGFTDAVKLARTSVLKDDVISISWGAPEDKWSAAAIAAMNEEFKLCAENGIGVYCASGDGGSSDGETFGRHVDFPASSPYVVACGGTTLELNPDGTRKSETAWGSGSLFSTTGSGGGESKLFPGRKVPDISGNADPQSGYIIDINGSEAQVGGTSGSSPFWAAYQALINAERNEHVGHLPALFYKADGCFVDVTAGSNGGYKATAGYDEVTGLGVLDGTKFLAFLAAEDAKAEVLDTPKEAA